MPIELLEKSEEKDEKDENVENVMEVCERLIRRLENLPIETSFLFHSTRDPHDVEPWPDQGARPPIPVEEVTKCLKMIAAPRILQVRDAMAFKTAMSLVADAFNDPLDLKVQIIKSLCDAFDLQKC